MTAHHYPGGPLWQPSSRSGIWLDDDDQGVYPGPDFPAAMVDVGPPALPLWEALDKLMPGCWGTPGGAE